MIEPTANQVQAEKAVEALRKFMPNADDQQIRQFIAETAAATDLFSALVKERRSPHDIVAMRFFLRMLEHLGDPVTANSLAMGDALFLAMRGD